MTFSESQLCNAKKETQYSTVQNRAVLLYFGMFACLFFSLSLSQCVCVCNNVFLCLLLLSYFIQTNGYLLLSYSSKQECHKKCHLGQSFNLHLGSKYHSAHLIISMVKKYGIREIKKFVRMCVRALFSCYKSYGFILQKKKNITTTIHTHTPIL